MMLGTSELAAQIADLKAENVRLWQDVANRLHVNEVKGLLSIKDDRIAELEEAARQQDIAVLQTVFAKVSDQPGSTLTYSARIKAQRVLAELDDLTPWAALEVLAWARMKTANRACWDVGSSDTDSGSASS